MRAWDAISAASARRRGGNRPTTAGERIPVWSHAHSIYRRPIMNDETHGYTWDIEMS